MDIEATLKDLSEKVTEILVEQAKMQQQLSTVHKLLYAAMVSVASFFAAWLKSKLGL